MPALALSALLATTATTATAAPAGSAAPRASVAGATRATFAGHWGGHGRGLFINRAGRAHESINDGCCTFVIDFRYKLSHIRGTARHAKARATITAVHVHAPEYFPASRPAPHVGETRTLRLRNGVISDPFIGTNFCDSAQQYKGTCGA